MSFGRLSAQFRTARVTHRSIDRATITIRPVRPTAGQRVFSGRVLVDEILGYLVADVGADSRARHDAWIWNAWIRHQTCHFG